MIDITESVAVAINAAYKIFQKKGQPDTPNLICRIDPFRESADNCHIDISFRVKGDPNLPKHIIVDLNHGRRGWMPTIASVFNASFNRESTWNFDNKGVPTKQ